MSSVKAASLSKRRDWIWAICYIAFLYGTLPVMPTLWRGFSKRAGGLANWTAALFLLAGIGIILCWLIWVRQSRTPSTYLWLLILVVLYAWALAALKLAVERIHFLEYGVLAGLLFRALRWSAKNRLMWLWIILWVASIGAADELIQYFLPNRVFDLRDIIVNTAAGILGTGMVALVIRPEVSYENI